MGLWDELKEDLKRGCKNLFSFAAHDAEVARCHGQLGRCRSDLARVEETLARLRPQVPPLRKATLKVDALPIALSLSTILIGLWEPIAVAGSDQVHWLAIVGVALLATVATCLLLGGPVRRRMRWVTLSPRARLILPACLAGLALVRWRLNLSPVAVYALSFSWFSAVCVVAIVVLRVVPQVHCVSDRGLTQFRELRAAKAALERNIRRLLEFIKGPRESGIEKAVVALVPVAIAVALRTGALDLDLGDSGGSDASAGNSGIALSRDPSHLIDINADGIADVTGAGTPVIPIDAYVRTTGLVRAHYRTVPDGILWNNIRGG